jgi:hypothetical protein
MKMDGFGDTQIPRYNTYTDMNEDHEYVYYFYLLPQ